PYTTLFRSLSVSVNYSKDFDTTKIGTIALTEGTADVAQRTGKTFFTGDKGDEVADYSMNYKKGTTLLRGVSVNFYAGTKRAKDATADDELSVSVNYSKDFNTTIMTTILLSTQQTNLNNRTSKTFYTGRAHV